MNNVRKLIMTAGLAACVALSAYAQENAKVTAAASSKLAPLPGLPACATGSAQRGDPSKGSSVLLAKLTPGCSIPWHWQQVINHLTFPALRARARRYETFSRAGLSLVLLAMR